MKGLKNISASIHIALSKHEDDGVWFVQCLWVLAWYFRKCGELPIECHGGIHKGTSYLEDEDVSRAACLWLESQKLGTVTSTGFCRAVNTTILPDLGVTLKKPLCNHSAWWWMYKLGFWQTTIQKGVYMDGHKCPDVVAYWENVFLPSMEKYECCMTQYHGPSLEQQEPQLELGQKHIIAQFHDESCFHANEFKASAWYTNVLLHCYNDIHEPI
jgi:hypothetical protein